MSISFDLSEQEADKILRSHEEAFRELVSLTSWQTDSLPSSLYALARKSSKTYTAIYTTTPPVADTKDEAQGGGDVIKKVLITLCTSKYLATHPSLLMQIGQHTSIPTPHLLKCDETCTLVSSPYAIYAYPPGVPLSSLVNSDPDSNSEETEVTRAKAEIQLGAHLRALHENVQNDWFGVPSEKEEWGECYSWQEAFTLLIENSLEELEKLEKERQPKKSEGGRKEEGENNNIDTLPIEDIRRALGLAIAYFLFDDVEVPSLVWCPLLSYRSQVFVVPPSPNPDPNTEFPNSTSNTPPPFSPGTLTALILSTPLWADPLLSGAFHKPSPAFLEGYASNPLARFPRLHTKRLWYDVYVSLLDLLDAMHAGEREKEREEEGRRRLRELVGSLEGAACY